MLNVKWIARTDLCYAYGKTMLAGRRIMSYTPRKKEEDDVFRNRCQLRP